VELRQAEALGVDDQHHRGIGHIHANLDHCGRSENVHLARPEGLHDRILLCDPHGAVQKAHAQVGEHRLLQFLGECGGGLGLELLGFLDQGADYIGLPALGNLLADEPVGFRGPGCGEPEGGHRPPAWRHLIEDRDLHIAVEGQGERARDGGSGHHQGVGLRAFGPQLCPLPHAEAVLLINDDQAEAMESNALLDESVSAHRDLRSARGNAVVGAFPILGAQRPSEQLDLHAQRLQQMREHQVVLLGQQLRRGHQRALVAVLQRDHQGRGGHDGLPRAHIALKQAAHGQIGGHVGGDLGDDALLGAGEGKGERLFEDRHHIPSRSHPEAGAWLLHLPLPLRKSDLKGQQFLEGQPASGRPLLRRRGGPVHLLESAPERK